MSFGNERIPTWRGAFQPEDETAPSCRQGWAEGLSRGNQERGCLGRQGVQGKGDGMDPVVHGAEFDPVSSGGTYDGRNGMLLGAPTTQGDTVQLRTPRQPQGLGVHPLIGRPFTAAPRACRGQEYEAEKEEASPEAGGRPPEVRTSRWGHLESATAAEGPDVGRDGPDLLVRDVRATLREHDPRMLLGLRHPRHDIVHDGFV